MSGSKLPAGWLGGVLALGAWVLSVAGVLSLPGCGKFEPPAVVLYSSVDDEVARAAVERFERETGWKVQLVGDTEATKTTGLVQRLLAERDSPRADVWWSSEALGSVRLAREGVLAPYSSPGNDDDFDRGWPAMLRGEEGAWYGFAQRPRVVVVNTQRVDQAQRPRSLLDLGSERFPRRVGLARASFGTTRGQMAYLLHTLGPERFTQWLEGLKKHGAVVYDGNAAVVRAVAMGEVDAGLTDLDDVIAGQREGWPVETVFEPAKNDDGTPRPVGTLMTPNTVGLVRGARHLAGATALVDFLLSGESERALAKGPGRNSPVRPAVLNEFPTLRVHSAAEPDWQDLADEVEPALKLVDRVLGP